MPAMCFTQLIVLTTAQVGRALWLARDALVPLPEAEVVSPRGREMPLARTHLSQAHTQLLYFEMLRWASHSFSLSGQPITGAGASLVGRRANPWPP